MPRFKCTNKECSQYGEEELFTHVKFVWNEKTKKLEADEATCPACDSIRETVREEGDIKIPWFKAENARNYDNKRIRKYDYDRSAANQTTEKLNFKPKLK